MNSKLTKLSSKQKLSSNTKHELVQQQKSSANIPTRYNNLQQQNQQK